MNFGMHSERKMRECRGMLVRSCPVATWSPTPIRIQDLTVHQLKLIAHRQQAVAYGCRHTFIFANFYNLEQSKADLGPLMRLLI